METEWTKVESNNVAVYHYDVEAKVLRVRFHSAPGVIYRYEGVEPEVMQEVFVAPAESIGRAFAKLIRGRYPTTKEEV